MIIWNQSQYAHKKINQLPKYLVIQEKSKLLKYILLSLQQLFDMFDIVNITGFQVFGNVEVNPTQLLIEEYRKKPYPKMRRIQKLDVTVRAVDTYINYLSYSCNPKQGKTLNLHMGVGPNKVYHLEMCGYNNKDFPIADNNGFKCSNQKIKHDMNLDQPINTKINVEALAEQLKKKGHKVQISDDPGRYLCNYIYFSSLSKLVGNHCTSLFIHFPPANVKSTQENLKFVNDVLDLLTN